MSTLSELNDFRERIRNWARVYRDRLVRNESNIMLVIRAIQRGTADDCDATLTAPDFRDADVIDGYVCRLLSESPAFRRVFKVLKTEYLTRYSVTDFESQHDEQRAQRYRARCAGVFVRDYDEKLMMAETLLMNFAKKRENAPF